ncbi:coiled-coil domain-containing protein 136 isoform X1 [Senna tora]|uniref:Coiled-coil domain-containing protein 136 isoform X1 n=1 Tax=Senna tora TaxID=362788 RepID=A0A834TWD6_9FABA|nr:coiled-coil domain-containing protein 136 isoform X1 [Senna tora]
MAEQNEDELKNLATSFIGLSFSLFLASLPKNSLSLVHNLQCHLRELSLKHFQAEEQLRLMKSRRQEDSKANARVVEIFASHRNAWQAEEKRLLHQIDDATEEIAHLRAKVAEFEKYEAESKARVEELEREVRERDEMISFMSRRSGEEEEEEEEQELGACQSRDYGGGDNREWFQKDSEECVPGTNRNVEEVDVFYEQSQQYMQLENGFDSEFLASASKFWAERATLWQDVQYEPLESTYNTKHFVTRRESPWKVDGDSAGVSSKLKSLEQELLNLEKIGKGDLSKVPSLMRKQAKRYQALSDKIDDLCRRIQASDPCEATLNSEFRTQRQTEFLLEAFRLQQRASETGQKMIALQSEVGKSCYYRDEMELLVVSHDLSLTRIHKFIKEKRSSMMTWRANIKGESKRALTDDGRRYVRSAFIIRLYFYEKY